MKNKLLFSLSLILLCLTTKAQWADTDYGANTSAPTDIISHNNTLIGTYAIGLKYSTDNGNNWTTKSTSHVFYNISRRINRLFSTGKYVYLFVTNNKNDFSTLVFRSSDDFTTFDIDTIGLKKDPFNGECVWLTEVYYAQGYFYAHTKHNGSWIKPVDGNWYKADKVELDGIIAGHNNMLYSSINKFSVSDDQGASWSTPTNNNYPNNFVIDLMHVDKITGRVYLGGITEKPLDKDDEPTLIYSDDNGANWNMITILPHLKTVADVDHKQQLTAIFTSEKLLYLGFENDTINSPIEILRSYDAGKTFVPEMEGLYKYAAHRHGVSKFLENNGTLFASVNGVYKRNYLLSTNNITSNLINITVYPNPASDKVYLQFDEPTNASIELYTSTGQKVEGIVLNNDNSIDVATLPKGIYILRVYSNDAYTTKKIIVK